MNMSEAEQKASYAAVRSRLMRGVVRESPSKRIAKLSAKVEEIAAKQHTPIPLPKFRLLEIEDAPKPEIFALVSIPFNSWRRIGREVAAKHNITLPEMTGRQRSPHIIIARHEYWYRLATEVGMTSSEIARRTGGFDPSTCLHGVRNHRKRLAAMGAA